MFQTSKQEENMDEAFLRQLERFGHLMGLAPHRGNLLSLKMSLLMVGGGWTRSSLGVPSTQTIL